MARERFLLVLLESFLFLAFFPTTTVSRKCVMCETGVGRREMDCINRLPPVERCHDEIEHCIAIFTYDDGVLTKAKRHCAYAPVLEGCVTVSYFNRKICRHLCQSDGCNSANDTSAYMKEATIQTPAPTNSFLTSPVPNATDANDVFDEFASNSTNSTDLYFSMSNVTEPV